MLAGEALYTIAVQMANRLLPMRWDDLPDTNSMWDYIDENGNMSYDRLKEAVKEAVNDRLSEEGYNLTDLGLKETNLSMNEGYNPDMYSTKEDLKQLVQSVKQRTGKGLTRYHIPMLAGEALYTIAVQMANKMLPMGWDDLPDTNSMWDYIDENGNMSYDRLKEAVKEAVNDRLSEEGYNLTDLGLKETYEEPMDAASDKYQRISRDSPSDYPNRYNSDRKVRMDTPEELQNYIGKIFTPVGYFQDYLGNRGVFQVDSQYRLRKVMNNLVSFDDLNDRSAETYKTLQQPIVKANIDDVLKYMRLDDEMNETNLSMIDDKPESMSNKATPTGSQTSGVPMGMQNTGGMSESYNTLLEEINNELNAFAIHHDKLKKMTEDRKPSALVLKDRVTADNPKNFKKDLKDSSVSKLVDIENALEYSDQQTEVKDPYKLGQDIEKTAIKSGDMESGEALKNVGNSSNENGDEIPKRNLSDEEMDDVNNYRLGLGDYIYDNEPGERFEKRMEKDMGKRNYDLRKKKIEARSNNNLYNKTTQPTDNGIDMVQYNKEKSGWNDREGIKESIVSGKYFDDLGKKRIIDFKLNEARKLFDVKAIDNLHEISLEGMGNSYTSKVDINEDVVKSITENKYYTNGQDVFVVKNPVQKLNENGQVNEKRPINNDFEKMKHLLNFNSNTFVDTKNVKKNRGF